MLRIEAVTTCLNYGDFLSETAAVNRHLFSRWLVVTHPEDKETREVCRRYGLEPYRYLRQRYTTVMVRVPRSFVDKTLWSEYLEIRDALDDYLNEATERIIREEVYRDTAEAPERA